MHSNSEVSPPSFCRWNFSRTGAIATGVLLFCTLAMFDAMSSAQAQQNQVEILITSDKRNDGSDGWVYMADGTKHWVSASCRAELLQAGAVLKVLRWPAIDRLADTSARQSCEELKNSLFTNPDTNNSNQVSSTAILMTRAKRAEGSSGWVQIAGGKKQWINGNCRSKLVESGATLELVLWSEVASRPRSEPRQSCRQLAASMFGTQPVTPTNPRPIEPPRQPVEPPAQPITPPVARPVPTSRPENVRQNLALIAGNATRNTLFDDNQFRDVPAADLSISDLTVNADIYNEGLLDTTNSGYFRVKCEVSHFAYDDPIVWPNQPGRAHLHMFFGNTEANAYSTYRSLLNTGTGTCNGEDLNRTAYWVPAMLDSEGNALIPDQVMVYYKNDNFRLNGANELVSPFPDNLRMISGNAKATSPQTDYSGSTRNQPIISFSCGPQYRSNDRRQALIPDCTGDENHIEMQIVFPQCVNEEAGTYRPDQAHTSFSEGGYYGARCPDSHPTDVSSIGSLTDLHLSSDIKMNGALPGGTTSHADWFGAWHPETMQMWVDNCNNTQADCETGLLDRDPAVSLVLRKRGFYPPGYRAPAEELQSAAIAALWSCNFN